MVIYVILGCIILLILLVCLNSNDPGSERYSGGNSISAKAKYTYDNTPPNILVDENGEELSSVQPGMSDDVKQIYGIAPSNWGDPIRIPTPAGPSEIVNRYPNGPPPGGLNHGRGYDISRPGPIIGDPIGVPVPQGTLKSIREQAPYRNPFYAPPYSILGRPIDGTAPAYVPSMPVIPPGASLQDSLRQARSPFVSDLTHRVGITRGTPLQTNLRNPITQYPTMPKGNTSTDFYRPYGPNATRATGDIPFFSSVDTSVPMPEIFSTVGWEKVGIVLSNSDFEKAKSDNIMNLYRFPIAPLQDLFKYSVQDKNGFIINLENQTYLEDGDIIGHIPGKQGSWEVRIMSQNKYVWV
jgi:hypothetical protein